MVFSVKDNSLFYLICFGLYSALEILISTEITYFISSFYLSLLKYGVFFIFFLFLIIEKFSFKNFKANFTGNFLLLIICLLYAFIIFIFSHTMQFFALFSFIFALKDVKYKSILKTSLFVMGIIFVFTILFALIGIYPNLVSYRGEDDRLSLGFLATTLPQSILLFMLLILYGIKGKRINIFEIITFLVGSIVIFNFTSARTSFLLTLFAIFCIILSKFKETKIILEFIKNNDALALIVSCMPLLFFIISLFFTFLLSIQNPFAIYLNGLLSTRLQLQLDAFSTYKINIFGTVFQTEVNGNYIGVDNSYLFAYFNYGVISIFLIMYLYYRLLKKSIYKLNLSLFFIIFVILVQGITDPYLIDFKYNPFILLSGAILFNSKSRIVSQYGLYIMGGRINGKRYLHR